VLPSLERSDSELIPHGRELQIAVTLQLDENGRVIAEKPTQRRSAPERLERLALEAALQWQFEPAKWGDRPMPSEYTVVFAFQR
jgi:TonB family protein